MFFSLKYGLKRTKKAKKIVRVGPFYKADKRDKQQQDRRTNWQRMLTWQKDERKKALNNERGRKMNVKRMMLF